MKFAIAEKLHEKYIEDVAIEVSQDPLWEKRLLKGYYNERFLVTYKDLEEIPCPLWTAFSQHGLEYFVSKIDSPPEEFSGGLIIFKFEAKGFPFLVRYSGNRK